MRWVGLDLHNTYVTACALDGRTRWWRRNGSWRRPGRRCWDSATNSVARDGRGGSDAAVGVGHRQLTAAGYPVMVAHPHEVKRKGAERHAGRTIVSETTAPTGGDDPS
ncbi:MAG TPA: hypothetical protein VNL18_11760 [Gemmatimonadales bacterium]|nr:hypothetical protein [Gemmatimonadales bacterium]